MSDSAANDAVKCLHSNSRDITEGAAIYIQPGVRVRQCGDCATVHFVDLFANVQQYIADECDEVKALLLEKNADYGNSFADPIGIFAKALTPLQQLNVRIDDKVKRIFTGRNEINEDTELDLIGYLCLKRVLRRLHEEGLPV